MGRTKSRRAGGGTAAPAPLTGSVGARALPVPGLSPLPARRAPATSGPAPGPAPPRRRRRRRCREWQPPVLPAPPEPRHAGTARPRPEPRPPGTQQQGRLYPPLYPAVPPLSPSVPPLCPAVPPLYPAIPPLSLLSLPLSPAGWQGKGDSFQRGQRKQEAAIKSCGKTFPLFGFVGMFFCRVGWRGFFFPPHFGICKSSCCKLPVRKPASTAGRAKVLLVWFFSPSRSESAC